MRSERDRPRRLGAAIGVRVGIGCAARLLPGDEDRQRLDLVGAETRRLRLHRAGGQCGHHLLGRFDDRQKGARRDSVGGMVVALGAALGIERGARLRCAGRRDGIGFCPGRRRLSGRQNQSRDRQTPTDCPNRLHLSSPSVRLHPEDGRREHSHRKSNAIAFRPNRPAEAVRHASFPWQAIAALPWLDARFSLLYRPSCHRLFFARDVRRTRGLRKVGHLGGPGAVGHLSLRGVADFAMPPGSKIDRDKTLARWSAVTANGLGR